ncbi:MAG: Fis family transcriptional regulator [Candidatus Schekmanbacteria bacterium RBG_13_48_7]|uniref:Fis family transcriptional regulator n=1 Tax=Candidatus Schekmanbacteria bacterium RBG_13_48_7 TaxID=1817878 RepID=A0A1F7S1M1_9BACT|nr:MAG: Fis family transcriptional regulator [Candidatus Schekmanbacteria bacterium RBG_13_48_7]
MAPGTILLVDDEENILQSLSRALKLEGYKVETSQNGSDALNLLKNQPIELMMIDVKMPQMNGLEVLSQAIKMHPDLPVIMMSGHGTIETAVKATRLGAYDFVEKPLTTEKLLLTIDNALRFKKLQDENKDLKDQIRERFHMIGKSKCMLELYDKILKIAPTSGRVFIFGENGTGKELVARAIHNNSTRKNRLFCKINCAAVPKELIESELFGHEKGSFTGASKTRKGKFEIADQGTLFLDEIGDMHLEMQAKLLRVLQEGEFERVGSSETTRIDVRIIVATNKNIRQEIEKGNFREDLYYRLNVIPFIVPSLRDHADDVPLLVEHFLKIVTSENGKQPMVASDKAIEILKQYQWPGNIRELKNIIERIVILFDSPNIDENHIIQVLPLDGHIKKTRFEGKKPLRDILRDVEKEVILLQLQRNNWHISQTAKDLALERSHLYKKMKQYNIDRGNNSY